MNDSSYLMLIYFKVKKQKSKKNKKIKKEIKEEINVSNHEILSNLKMIESEETVVFFNTNKSVKTLTYNNFFTRTTSFSSSD